MKTILIHILILFTFTMKAQQRSFTPTNAKGETEKRLALVIGNANYQGNALTNPLNDAKAMRTALQELGFTVQYYENLGKSAMEAALMLFSSDLKKHNVGLFYFAGHGFEGKDKVNYLMSTDMNSSVNEALAKDKSLNLDVVMQSMQDANANSNLLVIDACRNNPFRSWSRDGAKGLGSVSPALGTVVFFAASTGQAADDNRGGKNGLFTEEFLSQIRKPNLELSDILKNTSRAVYKRSGGQMPAITGNLLEDFYFLRSEIVTPAKPITDQLFMPMAFIKGGIFQMGDTSNEGAIDEKPVHQVIVSDFAMGKYEVTLEQFRTFIDATGYQTDAEKGDGSYIWDGSSWKKKANVSWKHDTEGNLRITSEYNHPVIHVSWNDAVTFCEWMSKKENKTYRLPTEAEWEYASGYGAKNRARFGNSQNILKSSEANFNGGLTYQANTETDAFFPEIFNKKDYSEVGEFRRKTTKVGLFYPNLIGLYDMSGNVWEWCNDWYGSYTSDSQKNPKGVSTGSSRVLKGGSWTSAPRSNRVVNRNNGVPYLREGDIGFRVASSQ
jgi:formylglycine-generating enzyme required for sulfatase activity